MKRLIIIVEGQTEEEFVNKTMRPYFNQNRIYNVVAFKIQTKRGFKGGFVNYDHLKNDVNRVLKSETNIIVTTFVDFFRMPTSVPGYNEMLKLNQIDSKLDLLETSMKENINDNRFVPYIQKYEFEALLFSSNLGFEEMYETDISNATNQIVLSYTNPEEINNNPNTSPSKRIIKILEDNGERYDKVVEGNLIAEEIGIEVIIEKCPRFNNWIENLINLLSDEN